MRLYCSNKRAGLIATVCTTFLITAAGICSDANNSSGNHSIKKPADGNDSNGPTVILGYTAASQDNPFASFMYFVPLVSPDTVDVEVSADNKQKVATISYESTISSKSFRVSCEFKMFGSGFHKYIFDPAEVIANHAAKASGGETIERMIDYIQFDGEGLGRVEVKGTIAGSSRTVTEVNLYFNSRGSKSPVTIGLYDVKPRDGQYKYENRTNTIIARVNSFAFKKSSSEPLMEINLASIKSSSNKEGFIAGLAGAIANFFINPPKVSKLGYDAMFGFGTALLDKQPSFTFPKAENIRKTAIAAVNKQ